MILKKIFLKNPAFPKITSDKSQSHFSTFILVSICFSSLQPSFHLASESLSSLRSSPPPLWLSIFSVLCGMYFFSSWFCSRFSSLPILPGYQVSFTTMSPVTIYILSKCAVYFQFRYLSQDSDSCSLQTTENNLDVLWATHI